MFQNYIEQSTKKVLQTLELAVSEMGRFHHNLLTPDFILLALLEQPDSEARRVIDMISVDPKTLVTNLTNQIQLFYQNASPTPATQIVTSEEVSGLFQVALDEAHQLGDQYISTGTLFLAMFNPRAGHASRLLNEAGLEREQALKALNEVRHGQTIDSDMAESEGDVLARYT